MKKTQMFTFVAAGLLISSCGGNDQKTEPNTKQSCPTGFTGEKCDQCADSKFTGEKCDQCADSKFTGEKCDQCADSKFTGANCDQCADSKFTGANCDQCTDSKFSGANCDQCADSKFTGANCDQCADSKFTGEKCDQCADSKFTGANCDQCSDIRFSGEACDECADGLIGEACDLVSDVDGNQYKTTVINDQIWTAENLKTKSGVTCMTDEENEDYFDTYGCLYSITDAKSVCPSGWHLPSLSDYYTLLDYVEDNMSGESAPLALIAKSDLWNDAQNLGQDEFGFSALPAGSYYSGSVDCIGEDAYFWTSTIYDGNQDKPASFGISPDDASNAVPDSSVMLQVRCLKD